MDCNQVRVEQPKIDAFGIFGHSMRLLYVGENFDVRALRDILDCLPVGRVVHHFEKAPFALVLPGGSGLIRVELNIVSEHCIHLDANGPVHFRHYHAALQVKFKRLAEHNEVLFAEQRAHELLTELLAVAVVESALTQLLF